MTELYTVLVTYKGKKIDLTNSIRDFVWEEVLKKKKSVSIQIVKYSGVRGIKH